MLTQRPLNGPPTMARDASNTKMTQMYKRPTQNDDVDS